MSATGVGREREVESFSRAQSPAFLKYKQERDALVAQHPGLLRLDCMNPVQALKHMFSDGWFLSLVSFSNL